MRVPLLTGDFLERGATVYAGRPAVIDEPDQPAVSLGRLTMGEVADRVRALSAGLDELGIGAGERIAVVSHNAARLLELLYAVPAAGRILVPVNFRLRPEEVAYIVEHSGASMLLVDPEVDAPLSQVRAAHRLVLGSESDDALLRPDREPVPWAEPDEDAAATINYTSGTTARPKGVQLTHRNIYLNALTFGLHAGVSDRDVYLHTLPMFHANGWGMPWVLAGLGVPQVVLRKVDGAEILRRVDEHGVTLLCAAPAVVSAVLDAVGDWPGEIPGRGRVRIICAGAPPPTRTIARVEADLGWEFVQIYGLTETSPLLTINRARQENDDLPPEDRAARLSRAGAPAIGVRLSLADDDEVLATSNVIMAGYWDNPEATTEAFDGGWFHTGDGGEIDDEGYLTIRDRKKDVIITGGENVSSIEVEDVIYGHPAVAEVAVIGIPHEKWGETVTALVVLAEGATADEADIIAHCKANLAGFKAPTSVEFRESIPRTATGKVQKFKLRQPYWE
ncbi:MAG: AMP-binding protein, partial [Actinomycetota bacterium]|nr:AMP-binding protein [Actinomycetota bacterium]